MKKIALIAFALISCVHTSSTMHLGYHGKASIYEIQCLDQRDCMTRAYEACPNKHVTVGNPNSNRFWVECE